MFEQNTAFSPRHEGNGSSNQLTCFICVKSIAPVVDDNSDPVKHSLCGILNHLKLNSPKLSSKEDGSWNDVRKPLCDNCSQVVGKVSGLCRDLEEIKLKINYYLNVLGQLIVVEENGQENGLTDKRVDCDQLKRKLKDECTSFTEGPTLRVVLPKVEVDTEAMEIEDNLLSSSSHYPNYIPKLEVEVTGSDDDDDNDDDDEDYKPDEEQQQWMSTGDQYEPSDSESGEELEVELQSEYLEANDEEPSTSQVEPPSAGNSGNSSAGKQKANSKMFSCSDCDSSFTTKPKLAEHCMVYHPEKFFPLVAKTDTATNPFHHKMYLIHLLNTEVDYCENAKFKAYKCIYCGKLFQNVHKRMSILTHLIKTHQDILRRELIQLKKEKSVDEIKGVVKMPPAPRSSIPSVSGDIREATWKLKHVDRKGSARMKREYTCATCGVRTTYPRSHHITYHPEKLFFKWKKSEEMKMRVFRKYCAYLIDKIVDKIRESREESGFRCPYCKKVYTELMACRHHAIMAHRDILGEELIELQENMRAEEIKLVGVPKVEREKCMICDVVVTKAGISGHMKKVHPEEFSKMYKCYDCVNCGKKISSRTGFREHQCTTDKSNGKKGSRVSGKFICGSCKRRFTNGFGLQYHHSINHVEEVFEGVKGEGVDGEVFKEMCQEVMEEEERGLEEVSGKNGEMRWKCGYCEETVRQRKLGCFHLVKKHEEILEGKVRKKQEEKMGYCGTGGVEVKMETDFVGQGVGEDVGKDENCLDDGDMKILGF